MAHAAAELRPAWTGEGARPHTSRLYPRLGSFAQLEFARDSAAVEVRLHGNG